MPFGTGKVALLGAAGSGGAGSSDLEFVQKHELTSGSSLIQFTGLDTTYDHYLILWRARHTNSADGSSMNIKMNSDTNNAVWQHRYMYDAPDSSNQANYIGQTYSGSSTGRIGAVVGTSDGKSAYHWSHGYTDITAANDVNVYNNAVGVSGGYKGGNGSTSWGNNGLYYYASTLKFQSQVTSIQITVNDGSYTFGSGSKFVLYGYKAAS
tara:strand:- start:4450 stop:5076 length:627 start_codon:yes stop_codon:yes gene_type:complete